jgi:site-specific recombinase XerD
MSLLYDSTARVQEIIGLKCSDLRSESPQRHVILTGKGNKTRLVPLMPNTILLYKSYLSKYHQNYCPESFLFYLQDNFQKRPLSQDCVSKFIEKYRSQASQKSIKVPDKITPHMFRNSRAMSLYRGGMPLPLLSEWLGHNNLKRTLIYANADTKMKEEAIEKAISPLNPLKRKFDLNIDTENDCLLKQLYGLS